MYSPNSGYNPGGYAPHAPAAPNNKNSAAMLAGSIILTVLLALSLFFLIYELLVTFKTVLNVWLLLAILALAAFEALLIVGLFLPSVSKTGKILFLALVCCGIVMNLAGGCCLEFSLYSLRIILSVKEIWEIAQSVIGAASA